MVAGIRQKIRFKNLGVLSYDEPQLCQNQPNQDRTSGSNVIEFRDLIFKCSLVAEKDVNSSIAKHIVY